MSTINIYLVEMPDGKFQAVSATTGELEAAMATPGFEGANAYLIGTAIPTTPVGTFAKLGRATWISRDLARNRIKTPTMPTDI